MGDRIGHEGAFAGILFQELHTSGGVIEEVLHPDGGADAAGTRLDGGGITALDAVDRGAFVRLGAGQHLHPRHAGNGSQCLAAEAEGMDMVQVVLRLNFTGGVADERRGDVLRLDAGAVVADLDQLDTAGFDGHRNLRCTGIDGIFQQLLDHRCGPLNDLTGGD